MFNNVIHHNDIECFIVVRHRFDGPGMRINMVLLAREVTRLSIGIDALYIPPVSLECRKQEAKPTADLKQLPAPRVKTVQQLSGHIVIPDLKLLLLNALQPLQGIQFSVLAFNVPRNCRMLGLFRPRIDIHQVTLLASNYLVPLGAAWPERYGKILAAAAVASDLG
jgi:hypothetical protein